MKKIAKAYFPKSLIRNIKNILTLSLQKKWKKHPIVADWLNKGLINEHEFIVLVFAWEKFKDSLSPPHKFKQMIIHEYAKKYNCTILVETGTYEGDMIDAQKLYFKKLYSIELAQGLWEKAVQRFKHYSHISILQGDSAVVLQQLVPKLEARSLFWLDGHYCGGRTAMGNIECPIYEELKAVFSNNQEHVVLIDDARLFVGKRDYPTMTELTKFIKNMNKDYIVSFKDDIIRVIKEHN